MVTPVDIEELKKKYPITLGREIEQPPGWTQFPGVKQVLKGFDWLHENVEKPFAALATAPFSPPTDRRSGESWFDHQVREYDEWEAPWGVKGVTEFIPSAALFAIPVGGTIGLAARGMGKVGMGVSARTLSAVGRGVTSAERAIAYPISKPLSMAASKLFPKKILPAIKPKPYEEGTFTSLEEFTASAMQENAQKQLARLISRVPIVGRMWKQLGPATVTEVEDKTGVAILWYSHLLEQGRSYGRVLQANYQQFGTSKSLMGADVQRMASKTIVKPKESGLSMNVHDIAEHYQKYTFAKPDAPKYSQAMQDIPKFIDEKWLKPLGITHKEVVSPDEFFGWLHRAVDLEKLAKGSRSGLYRSLPGGVPSSISKQRWYDVAADAIAKGVPYKSLEEEMALYISSMGKYAADTMLANTIGAQTVTKIMEQKFPQLFVKSIKGKAEKPLVAKPISKVEVGLSESEKTLLSDRRAFINRHYHERGGTVQTVDREFEKLELLGFDTRKARGVYEQYENFLTAPIEGFSTQELKATRRRLWEEFLATFDVMKKTVTLKAEAMIPKAIGEGRAPLRNEMTFVPKHELTATSLERATEAVKAIRRASRGESLPRATLAMVERAFPEAIGDFYAVLGLRPTVQKVIKSIPKEMWQELKVSPQKFKDALALYRGTSKRPIMFSEVDDAIKLLAKDQKAATKAIQQVYKENYKVTKDWFGEVVQTAEKGVTRLATQSSKQKAEWEGAKASLTGIKSELREVTSVPLFRGKLMPNETAEVIEKAFADTGHKWFEAAGKVSGVGRMTKATLDFSAPFIQGLFVLGRDMANLALGKPTANWAKMVTKQFQFTLNPKALEQYLAQPEVRKVAMERIYYGGYSGASEFYEAAGFLGAKVAGKPKAQWVTRETFGRFGAGFSGCSEVARNEMWKSLSPMFRKTDELPQLARMLDRMTGVMSSEALGVKPTIRQIENAFVFFAPRYTRANLAYLADVAKGGLAGREVRNSIAGLMAGGMSMYVGVSAALGQEPDMNPASGKFMTIEVGGQNIGIGGFFTSGMRFLANLSATIAEDPDHIIAMPWDIEEWRDYPFMKFMMGKSAWLTGSAMSIATRRDFLGEPFETPAEWASFLSGQITPIALQSIIQQKPRGNLWSFIAEEMGMRTFPKSPWQVAGEMKDMLAAEAKDLDPKQIDLLNRGRLKFKDLDVYQQKMLIADTPELQEAIKDAELMSARRAISVEDKLWNSFHSTIDTVDKLWNEEVQQIQIAVEQNIISKTEAKKKIQDISRGRALVMESLEKNEEYAPIYKWFEENPPDTEGGPSFNPRYYEYIEKIVTPNWEDAYGEFQYDKYQRAIDEFTNKYDTETVDKIRETFYANRVVAPIVKEYWKSIQTLKPYYELREKAYKLVPGSKPLDVWIQGHRGEPYRKRSEQLQKSAVYKRFQQVLTQLRKNMRKMNPRVDAALVDWNNPYGNIKPLTQRAAYLLALNSYGRVD